MPAGEGVVGHQPLDPGDALGRELGRGIKTTRELALQISATGKIVYGSRCREAAVESARSADDPPVAEPADAR
ncbi:hypothetical protein [Sinomonas atrocyanea]